MEWDQIESKWAAMTRRIRNDLSSANADQTSKALGRDARRESKARAVSDRSASVGIEQQSALSGQ